MWDINLKATYKQDKQTEIQGHGQQTLPEGGEGERRGREMG